MKRNNFLRTDSQASGRAPWNKDNPAHLNFDEPTSDRSNSNGTKTRCDTIQHDQQITKCHLRDRCLPPSTMSVSSLRSFEYLESLPGTVFNKLYQQPSTALAIFRRMLPHLGMPYTRGGTQIENLADMGFQKRRASSWLCCTSPTPYL